MGDASSGACVAGSVAIAAGGGSGMATSSTVGAGVKTMTRGSGIAWIGCGVAVGSSVTAGSMAAPASRVEINSISIGAWVVVTATSWETAFVATGVISMSRGALGSVDGLGAARGSTRSVRGSVSRATADAIAVASGVGSAPAHSGGALGATAEASIGITVAVDTGVISAIGSDVAAALAWWDGTSVVTATLSLGGVAVGLDSMLGLGSDIASRVLAAVEATAITLDAAGAESLAAGVSSSLTGAAGA
jgi:hypothetical protein